MTPTGARPLHSRKGEEQPGARGVYACQQAVLAVKEAASNRVSVVFTLSHYEMAHPDSVRIIL